MDARSTDPPERSAEAVRRSLTKLCNEGPVFVGFSGGLDSTVLLHLTREAALDQSHPVAVHVNHGVHPDADRWQEQCQERCASLGVKLLTHRVVVPKPASEQALRTARYRVFEEALQRGGVLLLAHHADDQLESALLGILRGRAAGEWTMPGSRPLGGGRIERPLLDLSRASLRSYAVTHGLQWIEDPSNRNPQHDRNLVRQQLLPMLSERFQLPTRLPALAQRQQQLAALADELACQDLRGASEAAALPCEILLNLPAGARRENALSHWVERQTGSRLRDRLCREVLRQLAADAQVDIRFGRWRLSRNGAHLTLTDA